MKRLLVTLLAVCMVVGMFAGLTVTASADYDTSDMVAYTMTAGDNVYNVCQKMGISFWDYETVIKTVNNIKSYSSISIGSVIYFPKPGSATTISSSSSSSSSGSSSTAGTTTTSTDTFAVKSDDKIAYYLIPHVMQSGETIRDVCTAYGVDYYSYSAKIAKINGLASCDNVKAGVTVLIPSISAPSGECYRVISHTMQSGDSVYNKCIEYGVNYYSNLTVLKGVNNTDNLNIIKVGATLYIPVAGTASGTGSASGSTGTGSSTGSATSTSSVYYNITIASAEHGTVSANVNDAAVVKAVAGSEVVISATPDKGYALDGFSVAATSGGAAVLSTDEGFTMPAYAVTVTPKFRQASSYKATANTAQHGTVKLQPAGGTAAQSQQITEGTKVTVVTTADKGYTLDKIEVKSANGLKTVEVNGNSFIMPSHQVVVTATFMSSETYTVFTRKSVVNGSYWIEVDGVKATEVNKGKTVTVCVDPSVGYELKSVHYYKTDATEEGIEDLGNKQTFVMPAYDVTVVVEFQKGTEHDVIIDSSSFPAGCNLTANPATALCGETVSLTATLGKGYKLDKITVTDDNGLDIPVSSDNTFTMPSTDVTVVASFKQGNYNITLNTGANGTATVLVNAAEVKTLKASYDDRVQIKVEAKPGYVASVTATNPAGTKEYKVTYNDVKAWYVISMPANAVIINVSFDLPSYAVTLTSTGSGTAELLKDGEKLDPAQAAKGDIVTVSLEPAPGCSVKSVKVVNGSDVENAIVTKVNSLTYTFKMPADEANVKVEFSAPDTYAINYTPVSGGTVSFIVDGYPVTEASAGDKVQIVITPDEGKELKNIQATRSGNANKVLAISNNSFTMPAYDVDVTASFADVAASTFKITKGSTAKGKFLVLAKDTDTKDTLTAAEGKEMYIKVTPNSGYAVDEIIISYNNGLSVVEVTDLGSNLWSFEMVDAAVTISVTYTAA